MFEIFYSGVPGFCAIKKARNSYNAAGDPSEGWERQRRAHAFKREPSFYHPHSILNFRGSPEENQEAASSILMLQINPR